MESNGSSTPNSSSNSTSSSDFAILPPLPSSLSDDEEDYDCNTMHGLVLRELNKEVDSLRRENAVLRSANTDLVKLLNNLFINASSPFLKPLGFGVFDGDEASDISPTSVIMEQHKFSSLPKTTINARVGKEEGLQVKVNKAAAYKQGMVKTELCNKWQESGACPYGDNCQFAHGVRELRPVTRHPRYKTQVCRMLLAAGTCPYGHRCHFRHSLDQHI